MTGEEAMLNHRVHAYIKVMVGFIAMFASVQAQGANVNGDGQPVNEGPFAEIVYIDIGPDETIECTAADPGYAYLDEEANGEETLPEDLSAPQILVEPPGFRVYRFRDGELPQKVAEVYFDENALGLDGHAYGAAGPFSTTIPNEQLVTLNSDTGNVEVLLLENTYDPDVNIDCTVFILDTEYQEGYYLDTTGQAVKKKAVKRKVAKANKRKVHKKKAKRKAAVKRKKAKRKTAG
jgi:hypothetical protein